MPEWLDQLLGKKKQDGLGQETSRLIKESELQSLRLALDEQEEAIRRLRDEIIHLQNARDEDARARVQSQLSSLFQSIAGPLVQMLAQHHLAKEGVAIKTENLANLTQQMAASLERYGLRLEGELDDVVPYDPARHMLHQAEGGLNPGEPVRIRIQGASLAGENLQKAVVTPVHQ
jgi:hypothetical protein